MHTIFYTIPLYSHRNIAILYVMYVGRIHASSHYQLPDCIDLQCGTWEGRTRSVRSGGTTTRTHKGSSLWWTRTTETALTLHGMSCTACSMRTNFASLSCWCSLTSRSVVCFYPWLYKTRFKWKADDGIYGIVSDGFNPLLIQ